MTHVVWVSDWPSKRNAEGEDWRQEPACNKGTGYRVIGRQLPSIPTTNLEPDRSTALKSISKEGQFCQNSNSNDKKLLQSW